MQLYEAVPDSHSIKTWLWGSTDERDASFFDATGEKQAERYKQRPILGSKLSSYMAINSRTEGDNSLHSDTEGEDSLHTDTEGENSEENCMICVLLLRNCKLEMMPNFHVP